ncbi:MAG: hypothetical protein GY805_04770 [Chloroflexi bacterium]|nr:hypothetical protein [Chloroflexota bacterium]
MQLSHPFFGATHGGAELNLLFFHNGCSYGVEIKFQEAPKVTKSMRIALETLNLEHLWVVYLGSHTYLADEKTQCCHYLILSTFLS